MLLVAKSIDPSQLGSAISDLLGLYHEDLVERLNDASKRAVKKLVSLTKRTAPKHSGDYVRSITHKVVVKLGGCKEFIWGAKAPEHRKTHLLVNGHLASDGSRVPGDPFLKNALDTVLPEYETDVEEVLSE